MAKSKPNCIVAIGEFVEVIASPYGDVSVGTVGKVVSEFDAGYGVEIVGQFTNALDTHNRHPATRTLWFTTLQLKRHPSPLP